MVVAHVSTYATRTAVGHAACARLLARSVSSDGLAASHTAYSPYCEGMRWHRRACYVPERDCEVSGVTFGALVHAHEGVRRHAALQFDCQRLIAFKSDTDARAAMDPSEGLRGFGGGPGVGSTCSALSPTSLCLQKPELYHRHYSCRDREALPPGGRAVGPLHRRWLRGNG